MSPAVRETRDPFLLKQWLHGGKPNKMHVSRTETTESALQQITAHWRETWGYQHCSIHVCNGRALLPCWQDPIEEINLVWLIWEDWFAMSLTWFIWQEPFGKITWQDCNQNSMDGEPMHCICLHGKAHNFRNTEIKKTKWQNKKSTPIITPSGYELQLIWVTLVQRSPCPATTNF